MPGITSTTDPNARAAPPARPPAACRAAAGPGTGSAAARATGER